VFKKLLLIFMRLSQKLLTNLAVSSYWELMKMEGSTYAIFWLQRRKL